MDKYKLDSLKDIIKKNINKYKNKDIQIDWEAIRLLNQNNELEANNALIDNWISYGFVPEDTTYEDFLEVFYTIKEVEINSMKCIEKKGTAIVVDDPNLDNNTKTYENENSSWCQYKKKLSEEKHFSDLSIELIQKDTEKIRKRLLLNCNEDIGAIKGVVMGSVQSGKTANMGALMAQCADNGWNCFIILGGMIDSLRKQTEDRLINDLSGAGDIRWNALNTICNASPDNSQELSNLKLRNSSERYLCVALKQKSRLTNLIKWLRRDEEKAKQLKVLIIDDEADQASVNTGKIEADEKKMIYNLIDQLVNGVYEGDKRIQLCGGMNYLCYTATPYANFLNDSDAKSLYPNNFIATLTAPDSYIGPQQIFGTNNEDEQGMSIIRNIPKDDKDSIIDIYDSVSNDIPESMENSIIWFLCCIASLRYRGNQKPFSMLINVSQKIDDHELVAEAVLKWFNSYNIKDLMGKCKNLWKIETSNFNKEVFSQEFSSYELIENIEDFPTFKEIEPYLYSLIECNMDYISVNENNEYQYTNGVHLCVDNSKNNKMEIGDNEDKLIYKRLVYPNKRYLKNNVAPAFIVIGGNTLSRGITIEGLVSTYFLRNGRQADSLMQMGRWFGYRIGYEIYPRIWMDNNTLEQFEFISQLDYDLRMNLNKYMIYNISPREVGPLINNTPAVSWLRITAKNKMQNVINASYDYTGIQAQTIAFEDNDTIINNNLNLTSSFLNSLNNPMKSRTNTSYVWKNIEVERVVKYFEDFSFCHNNRMFNDIEVFIKWLEDDKNAKNLSLWNVVLVSLKDGPNWDLNDNVSVKKVYRSRKTTNMEDIINIGILRSYRDNFEDITKQEISEEIDCEINEYITNVHDRYFFDIKKKMGVEIKPMLVIYIIDGNSDKITTQKGRTNIKTSNDLVGIYVNIPGDKKKNPVSQITVNVEDKGEEINEA